MDQNTGFLSWLGEEIVNWNIHYRIHATQRMFKRDFNENDIRSCLEGGIIIEHYKSDYPFPSLLICGRSGSGKPMHLVIGIDSTAKRMFIITVYEPDTTKWSDNFSRRIQ